MSSLPSSPAPRVIPVVDLRSPKAVGLDWASLPDQAPTGELRDTRSRALRDLRISVTDRCNFRCSYCMPKSVFDKDHAYLAQSELLSFEEITRLAAQFVAHGVQKIRLTGGEPLLRKNLPQLVSQLSALRTPSGTAPEITLTTNASLLARLAAPLKAAGLRRVTVSLDALDDATFRQMNDVDFPVADVLAGIAAAQAAGFAQQGGLKVNMVVKRGTNAHEILPMARHFHGTGVVLRFIEYMDVGATNGWDMREVLPSEQVRARIHAAMPLVPLKASTSGETATRWGYATAAGAHDASAGEVGFISSVTQAFCGECNRARLSTDGKLYLCLFASAGHDLRSLLRGGGAAGVGASDAQLSSAIAHIWQGRTDRYSELRGLGGPQAPAPDAPRRVEMSYIGG